jgi:hypothetical protein
LGIAAVKPAGENILEVLESVTSLREREVSARLEHFSDYALAW